MLSYAPVQHSTRADGRLSAPATRSLHVREAPIKNDRVSLEVHDRYGLELGGHAARWPVLGRLEATHHRLHDRMRRGAGSARERHRAATDALAGVVADRVRDVLVADLVEVNVHLDEAACVVEMLPHERAHVRQAALLPPPLLLACPHVGLLKLEVPKQLPGRLETADAVWNFQVVGGARRKEVLEFAALQLAAVLFPFVGVDDKQRLVTDFLLIFFAVLCVCVCE